MKPIISFDNVTFTYDGTSVPILKNLSLEIPPDSFTLILGQTGCGKSTLLQCLNGVIPHLSEGTLTGQVKVVGLDTKKHSIAELATRVGMVFQDPEAQLINVFVRDEINFGPENLKMATDQIKENAAVAIELAGLRGLENRNILTLSGGQKQKVALASVLSMRPDVLVLDEPTANLDPITRGDVFRLLKRLRQELGIAVVITEHNIDDLIELVDYVGIMQNGAIVSFDSPRRVFPNSFRLGWGIWMPQPTEIALKSGIEGTYLPLTVEEFIKQCSTEFALSIAQGHSPQLTKDIDSSTTPIIEIQNLTFSYKHTAKPSVEHISLTIQPGEFVALIGQNGSGKTTLAKTLVKINTPAPNTVFVNGQDVTTMTLSEVTNVVGYVFQHPDHQFVTDRVQDEVEYSLRVRNIPEEAIAKVVDNLLTRFNLNHVRNENPFSLSMGQKRLLSVATMLAVGQRLLILDEPNIGQDRTSAEELMQYLDRINQSGTTILIITHDMRLAAKWVKRAIAMAHGRVVYDGPMLEMFKHPDVLELACVKRPPVVDISYTLSNQVTSAPIVIGDTDVLAQLFRENVGQPITFNGSDSPWN